MDKLVKFTTVTGVDIAIRPDQIKDAYIDKQEDGTSKLIVETSNENISKFGLAMTMDDFLYQIN